MSILKLKDSQGNWISVPTLKGDKGNGIQSAVLNNDYTLTLTFTDGTTYTTPSIRGEKGEQGEPATDMDIHICSASEYDSETRIPTITSPDDKTFYLVPTEDGTSPDLFTEWVYVNNVWEMFGSASVDLSGYLTDVQLNGTSVVTDGVAEIPVGSQSAYGVYKLPSPTQIKNGNVSATVINTANQHESTFYGLAKVSGTDERDSTLPVGQYTDEAKSSIQDMLDVPSNADLDEVEEKVEQNTEDLLKAFPVETTSGSIASFEDGANDIPLQSLVVDINPVQDLHGYVSPWVGGGGKNLFDWSALILGSLDANGNYITNNNRNVSNFFVLEAGTYTFSRASTANTAYWKAWSYNLDGTDAVMLFNAGASTLKNTFTLSEQKKVRVALDYIVSADDKVQLEQGSTATAYAPYENICPISGWTEMEIQHTGKNLFDNTGINDHTTWEDLGSNRYQKALDFIKGGETYTVSGKATQALNGAYLYLQRYVNGAWELECGLWQGNTDRMPYTFTASNVPYRIWAYNASASISIIDWIQIELGTTATAYEPYNGTVIPISWQTEAGTVYGGSLDVLSGVMRITWRYFDGGDVTWTKIDSYNYGNFFVNTLPLSTYYTAIPSVKSSAYKSESNQSASSSADSYVWIRSISVGIRRIYVKDTSKASMTVDEFKTAMTGVQFVYELAEPIEIQLDAHAINSLYGVNNIFADTGDTSLEYRADPDLYIQRKMPEVPVDDVQINGTSIIENGVANIPLANSDKFGVVKINGNYGIQKNSSNLAVINRGNDSEIKIGTNSYKPIVPYSQHQSVFYGLAKAASDTTQSASSNTVGNYTDEAKASIQNMLGITDKYSPKEWMAESETELVTNAHSVGDLFYIGETLYKVITDLNAGDAVNVGVNVEEVNVNNILDDYATKEDVQDNISIVEKSALGAIVSFDDGADDIPLKELVVDINPVQDLHGYNSPWVDGAGKNVFDQDTVYEAYKQSDGSFLMTGGNGVNTKFYIPQELVGKELTFSAYFKIPSDSTLTNARVAVNVDGTATSGTYANTSEYTRSVKTFTPVSTDDCVYITYGSNGGQFLQAKNIQLEIGSTVTDYAPYKNICPISGQTGCEIGVTGKNLLALSVIPYSDMMNISFDSADYMWMKAGVYTLSYQCPVASRWFLKLADKDGNMLSDSRFKPNVESYYNTTYKGWFRASDAAAGNVATTFTLVEDCYLRICKNKANPDTIIFDSVQLEVGDTATDYEPYTGRTITIDLGQTVYGAKLYPLEGKALINMAIAVFDGTEPFINNYFPTVVCTKAFTKGVANGNSFVNSHLPSLAAACSYANEARQTFQFGKANEYWGVSSADELKTIFAQQYANGTPVTICYPLAEPVTIQLTSVQVNSLLGVNNIFADTGDTSIEYFSQVDEDLVNYIKANLNSYAKKDLLNNYVNDVQIEGTSIVENGITEIPFATSNVGGVVKIDSSLGIKLNDTNKLLINRATATQTKAGTDAARPIVPICQHESVFYGLTKAAGVDMASSSNTVGTYTEEAKTAIKQMLGVHDTIDSFVEEVTGTDVTITGQPSYRYNCGELYSLTVTPPESGTIDIRFTSGSTPTVLTLPLTVKMPEWWVEVEANTIYEMCITDGIYCGVMSWAI